MDSATAHLEIKSVFYRIVAFVNKCATEIGSQLPAPGGHLVGEPLVD